MTTELWVHYDLLRSHNGKYSTASKNISANKWQQNSKFITIFFVHTMESILLHTTKYLMFPKLENIIY